MQPAYTCSHICIGKLEKSQSYENPILNEQMIHVNIDRRFIKHEIESGVVTS